MIILSGRGACHGSGFSAAVTLSHRLWKASGFPGSNRIAGRLTRPAKGTHQMHGISRLALVSALATTALADPIWAQDGADIALDEITVIASTEPVPLGRTGATVNVVSSEDLAAAGNQSAAALLSRLPGVSMSRNGGLGTSTALRIRGLSGPYIGVRIDGIDVADPSGTQCAYDFGSTTSGGLSRIEVLRGSQSALFGSEAIGGVVDITTFRATQEGTEAQVTLEAGSDATYSGSASVGVKTDRAELAFTLARTVTDGISAYAFGTEDDAFRATTLSFYGSYAVTDTLTLGMNGFARDSYSEFDSQYGDSAETESGKLRALRGFAALAAGATEHELSFARTTTERDYPLGFLRLYSGEREQLAYKGRWQAGDRLSVNWGLDRTSETFGAGSASGTSRTTSALTEVLYAPSDALDLSLALRHDDHSQFGGQASGRAALAWRPNGDWVIRAVAGTGFRAPSLYELYGPFGTIGLRPEESRSFELGAEYLLPAGGSLQATLFDTRIEDKIDFVSSNYRQTSGTTRTRGIELIGRTAIAEGWEVFGNYTFTDASLVSRTGVTSEAIRVPRHDLVLGVEGRLAEGWTGQVTVQHVAGLKDDYYDLSIGPFGATRRVALPDYTIANVSLAYEVNDKTTAYLRIENLFDEQYQTVTDYGQPGRSVFVGLSAQF
ncbi:TonB-dependent receptor plug domain-containing protein [Pseudotabrizicola formosa]|uniref:TonB-dependent receptor plug domain-containing protein n=1 Tax=Pseudotabrizicola formosa TaxID=2030009 RepID=UPI001FF06118|nr:TonB-dependent receptor [Pseudotabrizicola formosa]